MTFSWSYSALQAFLFDIQIKGIFKIKITHYSDGRHMGYGENLKNVLDCVVMVYAKIQHD